MNMTLMPSKMLDKKKHDDILQQKRETLKEKIEYKDKIMYPYKSQNIFKELNMENLTKMYQRAHKEEMDALRCFNITSEERREIVLSKDKKHEKEKYKIIFNEICFISKVVPEEVDEYLKYLTKRRKVI